MAGKVTDLLVLSSVMLGELATQVTGVNGQRLPPEEIEVYRLRDVHGRRQLGVIQMAIAE